jgi:cell division protein FtsL
MREFIAIMIILCLILMAAALIVFCSKQTREIFIIRDYEIVEDKEAQRQLEQFSEEQENRPRREAHPDTVVPPNPKN